MVGSKGARSVGLHTPLVVLDARESKIYISLLQGSYKGGAVSCEYRPRALYPEAPGAELLGSNSGIV